jgi:hypothetical protein
VLVGFVATYLTVRSFRENYTSTEALELPRVEASQSEIDAVLARVREFGEALDRNESPAPLSLSQQDLNILIQHHPELRDFSEVVYVTLENDQLNGQMSVPLSEIPGFGGRYFNGQATFDVAFRNDQLEIYVDSATIGDRSVPESFMETVRSENLAADFQRDVPESRDHLRKIESIAIRDGQVVLTPHAAPELEPLEAAP